MSTAHTRTPPTASFVTPEEYFAIEAEADARGGPKHEYINGRIREMVGGSPSHGRVERNLWRILGNAVEGTSFEYFGSDTRVRINTIGDYYYPDATIAPYPAKFHHSYGYALINPIVVFEVLSPSTESFDRNKKLKNYAGIDSVRDYVLVAQDRVEIDHFWRETGDDWHWANLQDASATLSLKGVDISLSVAKLYDRVSFEAVDRAGDSE